MTPAKGDFVWVGRTLHHEPSGLMVHERSVVMGKAHPDFVRFLAVGFIPVPEACRQVLGKSQHRYVVQLPARGPAEAFALLAKVLDEEEAKAREELESEFKAAVYERMAERTLFSKKRGGV